MISDRFIKIGGTYDTDLMIGVNQDYKLVLIIKDCYRDLLKKKLIDNVKLPDSKYFSNEVLQYLVISRIQEMYIQTKKDEVTKNSLNLQQVALMFETSKGEEILQAIRGACTDSTLRVTFDTDSNDCEDETLSVLETEDTSTAKDLCDVVLKVTRPSGVVGYLQLINYNQAFGVVGLTDNVKDFGSSIIFYDLVDVIQRMNKEQQSICRLFVLTQVRHALINNGFTGKDLGKEKNWNYVLEYVDNIIKYIVSMK